MLTICGEHGSPLDGDDHLAIMRMRDTHLLGELRHGACEDDCESAAPYIGMCPDESAHPEGSPLDFGGITSAEARAFDESMAQFMRMGFDYSYFSECARGAHTNGRDPYLSGAYFGGTSEDYANHNPPPISL